MNTDAQLIYEAYDPRGNPPIGYRGGYLNL